MSRNNDYTFKFKNKTYHLDRLQTAVKSGLDISVRVSELAFDFQSALSLPKDFDDSNEPVAFYQFDGKYYVLLGMKTVVKIVDGVKDQDDNSLVLIPGALITKHALKRLEVNNNPVDLRQFTIESRPRYGDRSVAPSRSYGSRERPVPTNNVGYIDVDTDYNCKPTRTSRDSQRNR